jgi:hypothetical protein
MMLDSTLTSGQDRTFAGIKGGCRNHRPAEPDMTEATERQTFAADGITAFGRLE